MTVCLYSHTPLMYVTAPVTVCVPVVGAGMKHGHSASELNSQKQGWS